MYKSSKVVHKEKSALVWKEVNKYYQTNTSYVEKNDHLKHCTNQQLKVVEKNNRSAESRVKSLGWLGAEKSIYILIINLNK